MQNPSEAETFDPLPFLYGPGSCLKGPTCDFFHETNSSQQGYTIADIMKVYLFRPITKPEIDIDPCAARPAENGRIQSQISTIPSVNRYEPSPTINEPPLPSYINND